MENKVRFENEFLKCQSHQEAKELLNKCVDGQLIISLHDGQGMYLAVSPSVSGFLGYEPRDLIGNSAYDFFHPSDFETVLKSHAKVTILPEVAEVFYRVRLLDGKYQKVRSVSKELVDEQNKKNILVITIES